MYHTLHNLPSEWFSALVDTLVRAALFKKEFRFLTITNKTKWRPGASSHPKEKGKLGNILILTKHYLIFTLIRMVLL